MPVTSSGSLQTISSGEALESEVLPTNEGQAGHSPVVAGSALLEPFHPKEIQNTYSQDHTEKDGGVIK